MHPGDHETVLPNAPERIRDLAFHQVADIRETALALEIEIGDRAGNRNERPDEPAVAVYVFDQPIVGRGFGARRCPQQHARILSVVIVAVRGREEMRDAKSRDVDVPVAAWLV